MSLESTDSSTSAFPATAPPSLAEAGDDHVAHERMHAEEPENGGVSEAVVAETDAQDSSPSSLGERHSHDQDMISTTISDNSTISTSTSTTVSVSTATPADPTGGALFDYSSYTGGAPSLLTIASGSGAASASNDASNSVVASNLFGQELDAVAVSHHELVASKHIEVDDKRIGRPSHPAWEHFARGEKRNRFHHNAYCRYCTANGIDPEPIRGVSENMIRHLQKCIYCPEEIVSQLKMLCAQKDAARFSKRHQTHPSDVDMLLHESPPVSSNKRVKRNTGRPHAVVVAHAHPIPLPAGVASSSAASSTVQSGSGHHNVEEEFMPLQLPLLPSEIASAATQNALSLQSSTTTPATVTSSHDFSSKHPGPSITGRANSSIHMKARLRGEFAGKKYPKTSLLRVTNHAVPDHQQHVSHQIIAPKSIDPVVLNRLVLNATLSAGLPWDWVWMEESACLFGDAHGSLELPRISSILPLIATSSHEKQFAKMKLEHVGITLAINSWVSKYQKTNFALFSLVNALGEASVWDLVDLGLEEPPSDVLADRIKSALMALHDQSVQVISIVVDTTNAYAAARFAVSAMENSSHDIPVLPCFSQFLSLLLGVVLTVSDVYVETMGDVIEIVQMFSNHRVLKVLRRECGDQDASLVLPTKDNWYSFIECIDSVRQYEDMIKIIASKVLAASSGPSSSLDGSVIRPTRKDSAGNTVDELAETRLSSSVLRAIQTPEFWENVVSLSELMSPIKETHKIMTSGAVSQFSMSDVLYQFGRMHQQYGIIISDWEDNTCGRRTLEHVRFLQETVNKMWKLYDQPLMFLSYILNYNLVYPHVSSQSHPSLQWLSIGKYAKEYFRRWFCSASPLPSRASAAGTTAAAPRIPLSEDTASRFLEDILAYKERKYPFDMESVCEFENPRSFYLLVSDSNPLMHLFGSRLFSFATSTPPLSDVVPGISFVLSATSAASPREVLLPVLQMKLFTQTAVRPSKDLLAFLQNGTKTKVTGEFSSGVSGDLSSSPAFRPMSIAPQQAATVRGNNYSSQKVLNPVDCGMDARACATVWNKKQWTRLAKEWRAHWEKETDTEELLRSLALLDPGLFRFSPNLSLDQIFKDKLPSRLPQDREEAVVDV